MLSRHLQQSWLALILLQHCHPRRSILLHKGFVSGTAIALYSTFHQDLSALLHGFKLTVRTLSSELSIENCRYKAVGEDAPSDSTTAAEQQHDEGSSSSS